MNNIFTALILVFLTLSSNIKAQEETAKFEVLAGEFFAAYVDDRGMVDYKAISEKPKMLNYLVEKIAVLNLDEYSGNDLKAAYVNIYNILVINRIIAKYPIKSVMDIPDFFDETDNIIGGQKISLNELEKGILFVEFPDPHLHFALVCGANGCPPLQKTAYTGEMINDQLVMVAQKYISFKNGNIKKGKDAIEISQIFNWYNSDFILKDADNELDFINKYLPKDSKLNSNSPIKYYKYDWTLNAQNPVSDVSNSRTQKK